MPPHARFIVFEGLDGAGTTTQAAKLQALFSRQGTPSYLTNEPTSDPIGAFIRRLLTSNERGADGSTYRPDERTMGLLFAADRLAHSAIIEERLRDGESVVCDRYIFSSMAYQTLDASIRGDWVIEVNAGCAVPDVTFFLSVPVDVCMKRLAARRGDTTIYEDPSQLEKIARNYDKLIPLYEANFGRLVRIDGNQPVDDVHATVVAELGL